MIEIKKQFDELLHKCVQLKASDVHVTSGDYVRYRVYGELQSDEVEILSSELVSSIVETILNPQQKQEFAAKWTVDLGYTASDGERFRINCYLEMGLPALAVRHLNQNMLSFSQLGLPEQLKELSYLQSGLVLITGATGSGKSTTLALLLDEINCNRNAHILTVEDPVEFVHKNKKSLVHHREINSDVPSFAEAVRAALREDPDVIMVGEMRDLETMKAAMAAAETGHLVFSTMHTGTAVGAVERFIGHFTGEEQTIARQRFSLVLRAVVAQQLVPGVKGARVPAVEILKGTHATANMIRGAKTEQMFAVMESGMNDGMWTLDQALAKLVKSNRITMEEAKNRCVNEGEFERLVAVSGGY